MTSSRQSNGDIEEILEMSSIIENAPAALSGQFYCVQEKLYVGGSNSSSSSQSQSGCHSNTSSTAVFRYEE